MLVVNGAQSVMIVGIRMTHELFAVSWGTLVMSGINHPLTTVKAVEVFGWMKLPALARSRRSVTAAFPVGVQMTAVTVRMLELLAVSA